MDRLFEGEEAVLHVIDASWPSSASNVALGGRATSGRLAGADPIS